MTSNRHVPALDGVRGIAALSVFLFHYGGGARSGMPVVRAAGFAVKFGATGVPLFFVLSGFLISGILWDGYHRPDWWKNFFARRSLRIFPLYYGVLLLAVLTGLLFQDPLARIASFWPYFLYLQNMPVGGAIANAPTHLKFYHLWSLAVEEQFYLLWPFILWPFRHRIKAAQRLCLTILILSLVFRIWIDSANLAQWGASVPAHAGELSMGGWLALAMRESDSKRHLILRWAPLAFVFALAGVCADALVGVMHSQGELHIYPTTVFGLSIYALLFTSLIALCLRPGIVARFFSVKPLCAVGKISYGIYVYHVALMPLYYWLLTPVRSRFGHNAYQGAIFCVAFVSTLSVATLSFRLFESRIGQLKRRFPSSAGVPVEFDPVVPASPAFTQSLAS